jgi:hypothetical protein
VLIYQRFLPLPELLEYLQLTDIYLFTSKDPQQAVSGTFSYAMSSGCPIIFHTHTSCDGNWFSRMPGLLLILKNSQQLA